MLKHPITYIILILSLFGILSRSYIWKQLPVLDCGEWAFIRTQQKKYYIHPEKIVIEPWLGQHHVYGIFMVPDAYKRDELITVNIPGNQTYCGILLYPSKSYAGIEAKPGHHLMKGYFQTRSTIAVVLEGKLKQLQQPTNWRLGYIKEIKKNRTEQVLSTKSISELRP